MTAGLLDSLAASGPVQVIGLTLLHFVWQGALIGIAAAVALRFLRRGGPSVRYVVACSALALLAATPVATALVLTVEIPATPDAEVTAPGPGQAVGHPDSEPGISIPGDGSVTSRASDGGGHLEPLARVLRGARDRALPLIVAAWLLGVLLCGGRHLGGWLYLRRSLLRRTRPLPDAWDAAYRRVRSRVGVGSAVRAALCRGIDTPMVVGCLRPTVLLPVGILSSLPPGEVGALIAHELAHVKRLDGVVNLLQVAAETLFFFHPVVWWLSDRIRSEREMCCDDLAAAACGSRTLCARALAHLSGAVDVRESGALAASAGSLPDRIRHLVRPGRTSGAGAGLVMAAVLLLSTAVGAQLVVDGGSGPTAGGAVLRPPAGLVTLEARWDWALTEIRRRGEGAVGWGLGEVAGGGTVISNSPGGPPTEGGSSLRAHLDERLDTPLPRAALVLGAPEPGDDVEWIRLRGIEQRIDLGGRTLFWLGTVEASESLVHVDGLLSGSDDPTIRKELAAALSLHGGEHEVLGAVRRVIRSDPDDAVRAEAAAWLDRQPGPGVAALLHEVAASDPSSRVREEAITALGNLRTEEALRVVRALALDSSDPVVRETALQSLEDHPDPDRLPVLAQVIFDDPDPRVRETAVEVLADLDGGAGEDLLRRVATSHRDPALREAARDELADRGASR